MAWRQCCTALCGLRPRSPGWHTGRNGTGFRARSAPSQDARRDRARSRQRRGTNSRSGALIMMQRWKLPAFGRNNLVLTPALRPKPDPKEVLVKVEAVSLNHLGLLSLKNGLGGGYVLPVLAGSAFAGSVNEIRAKVYRIRP